MPVLTPRNGYGYLRLNRYARGAGAGAGTTTTHGAELGLADELPPGYAPPSTDALAIAQAIRDAASRPLAPSGWQKASTVAITTLASLSVLALVVGAVREANQRRTRLLGR